MMPRGQVAYEFLLMFFFLTSAFTVWLIFSAMLQSEINDNTIELHMNDLGLQLQDELYKVAQMPEGFRRKIYLPPLIYDRHYIIQYVTYGDEHYYGIMVDEHEGMFRVPAMNDTYNVIIIGADNYVWSENGLLLVNDTYKGAT